MKTKLYFDDEIANAIMNIDWNVLTKYNKDSGCDLKEEPLRTEFLSKVKALGKENDLKFPLSSGVASRIEWENFHTALSILMEEKLIKYDKGD